MTQDDINNGRLVCVIGIAPVKPAEFVIFRRADCRWTGGRGGCVVEWFALGHHWDPLASISPLRVIAVRDRLPSEFPCEPSVVLA